MASAPHGPPLATLDDFGSNPGQLAARIFIPKSLRANAPLVVVLHGCTQTASAYNASAGWSAAAEEGGFALLFPEQRRANNSNLCFNWFSTDHATRGRGEALSIRQMVAAMQATYGCDPARVFVSGLSAGGAMAAVMLATYPDVFAGGAIIAGLPFGTARSLPEALDRMRGHSGAGPDALAQSVRSASDHSGPWPILSVWHGTSDSIVDRSNARAVVDQWRTVHGLAQAPSRTNQVDGYPHRVWTDAAGRPVIEQYDITGMGHGTPLSTARGLGEVAAPHMLEAGISSTRRTLSFWGIGEASGRVAQPAEGVAPPPRPKPAPLIAAPSPPPLPASGIQKTIEDALRSAGLMR